MTSIFSTLLCSGLFVALVGGPFATAAETVDLVLLLAVDVSGSIGDAAYDLQHRGTVEALRDPVVHQAIEACTPNGIAIGYAEWGARRLMHNMKPYLIEPFVKIENREDLVAFADRVGARGRSANFSSTDVGGALVDGTEAISAAPFTSDRRTIDVSSDGLQGPPGPDNEPKLAFLTRARDEAAARQITVNALILDPISTVYDFGDETRGTLEAYWQKFVIAGPNAFTIHITDSAQFKNALVRKLRRELCDAIS